MKKYEVNRVAVLIGILADILECSTEDIINGIQGNCIDEEDAGILKRTISEMNE